MTPSLTITRQRRWLRLDPLLRKEALEPMGLRISRDKTEHMPFQVAGGGVRQDGEVLLSDQTVKKVEEFK